MSQQITEAFVQQYNANVMHLSQQKGSRLQDKVRRETQKGKSQFFDRIGSVAAVKRVGRHAQTPQFDTPHSRRMVVLEDYEWADLVDDQDKIRMLIDPTSEYAMAAAWAMGRAKDDVIIAQAIGTAYSGETGATAVVLPDSQKYAANNGSAFTNLNVSTLRAIRKMFMAAEVDVSAGLYLACSASQIAALLGQTEVTNADYNSVKALVQGEVDTFMGFKFVQLERLNSGSVTASATTGAVGTGTPTTGRFCFAWAKNGVLLSTGEEMVTKIDQRSDLGYATQVYARQSIGGTRLEEQQVVQIVCAE